MPDLAWRMAVEALAAFTGCLPTVSPGTHVGWYSDPFPDQVLASANISMQPSMYTQTSTALAFYNGGSLATAVCLVAGTPAWAQWAQWACD